MRVRLDLHDPPAHWIALSRVIENNPDLPGDAVLVVRKHDVVVRVGASGRQVEVARAKFGECSVDDLPGKMAFLEWLQDCLSSQRRY